MRSHFIPFAVALLVSGCSALGALNNASTPLQIYELRAPMQMPQARRASSVHLTIEEPTTSGALMTDAILIRPTPRQASYLPDGQWSEDLPITVQTLMIRALQSTNGFAYVGRDPLGLNGDYALLSELIDFQAVLDTSNAEATPATRIEITLLIQIIRERDAHILATRRFQARTPAAADTADAITAAMDSAMAQLLPEIARWTMTTTGVLQ